MSSQTQSIQAYFHRTTKPTQDSSQAASPVKGTQESGAADVARPASASGSWSPRNEYPEIDIVKLEPGLGCVMLTGRIANYYEMPSSSKMPSAAKGSFRIILKDDTGTFTVCCIVSNAAPPPSIIVSC